MFGSCKAQSRSDQIRERVRNMVYDGTLKPGQRLPTDVDLAKQFGVSPVTLSRAMTALVDEGVVTRLPGRGTHICNSIARGTVVVTMGVQQLCQRDGSGPFFHRFVEQLMEIFAQHQVRAQFVLGSGATSEEHYASLNPGSAIWREATAVISASMPPGELREAVRLPAATPVLSAFASASAPDELIAMLDYYQLGLIATEHLIDRGHRRIALLGSLNSDAPETLGYLHAMDEARLESTPEHHQPLPRTLDQARDTPRAVARLRRTADRRRHHRRTSPPLDSARHSSSGNWKPPRTWRSSATPAGERRSTSRWTTRHASLTSRTSAASSTSSSNGR